jgi:hypothetical protein
MAITKIQALETLQANFKAVDAAEEISGNSRVDVDSLVEIARDGELNGTKFSEEVEAACEELVANGRNSIALDTAGQDRFITSDELADKLDELYDA